MSLSSQNYPIYNLSNLYINGLTLQNDATTPNTVLDIVGGGSARDYGNVIDLSNPNIEGLTSNENPFTVNAAINGPGGLDTGSIQANKVYAIYLIGDSSYYRPRAGLLSLNLSNSPLMPFGYDSLRLIGYWTTDGSNHFYVGYTPSTINSWRSFVYDVPVATSITAGHATTYTAINLANIVPARSNITVQIQAIYTPATAGNTFKLQPGNGVGDGFTFYGQVATVPIACYATIIAQPNINGNAVINYKVSNGSDSVAINVLGFSYGV